MQQPNLTSTSTSTSTSNPNPSYQILLAQPQPQPQPQPQTTTTTVIGQHYKQEITELLKKQYNMEMFDELAKMMESEDVLLRHQGVIGMRVLCGTVDGMKVLQKDKHYRNYIQYCLIDRCLVMAKQDIYKHLKNQACFVLANLAVDERFCGLIVQKNGIELLTTILREQKQELIVSNAIWTIGNICADSSYHRNLIIPTQIITLLITHLQSSCQKPQISQILWVLQIICQIRPFKQFKQQTQVCCILCEALNSGLIETEKGQREDRDELVGILWALYRITEGRMEQVEVVRRMGMVGGIVGVVGSGRMEACLPGLKILGNFATLGQIYTDQLINNGILDVAFCLINHPRPLITQHTCWLLSNIAAGSQSHKKRLLSHNSLMRNLSILLWQPHRKQIQIEILWVFGNLAHQCPQPMEFIKAIFDMGVFEVLVRMLDEEDSERILKDILEIIQKILNLGKSNLVNNRNPILCRINNQTYQKFQNLLYHHDQGVYHAVTKVLLHFFDD